MNLETDGTDNLPLTDAERAAIEKRERTRERKRAYYLAHREEYIARARAQIAADPARHREYNQRAAEG